MSKLEDTRIVTFKEDYTGRKAGDKSETAPIVYMEKGSTHAIHKSLVAKLAKRGAKMEISEVDVKKVTADAKRRHQERQERREKDAYVK